MKYILQLIAVGLLLVSTGCSSNIDQQFDEAKALMQCAPDSSELILNRLNFNDQLTESQRAKLTILLSMAKLKKGKTFATSGDFNEVQDYYKHENDTVALLTIYQLASDKMRWFGDQDSASIFLNKAIDIASEATCPTKSELLIKLSNLYSMPSLNKNYTKAISYAKEALRFGPTKDIRIRALHDIGLFYSFIGQNDSASIYIVRALTEADDDDPYFTTYALNYANNPSADFRRSVAYLNRIKSPSLGKQITLGFLYLNHSQIDSARYYLRVSKNMYNENPSKYSINTYNNLRLLEQSIGLLDNGIVFPNEGTVINDSISEVSTIQRKLSEERRDYNNQLQIQLLLSKAHRQQLMNFGLGLLLILSLGFGSYVWFSKRKFLKLKERLEEIKVEQIVAEANDGEPDKTLDLIKRRMVICIEQFRDSKLQSDLDKMAMQYRCSGNYPPVKERERTLKILIGCFADFIVDLKMTGVKINMEDIVTCIMSCLRESNVTIAACLGTTETAVRTRKSRLRAKLPVEILDLLEL